MKTLKVHPHTSSSRFHHFLRKKSSLFVSIVTLDETILVFRSDLDNFLIVLMNLIAQYLIQFQILLRFPTCYFGHPTPFQYLLNADLPLVPRLNNFLIGHWMILKTNYFHLDRIPSQTLMTLKWTWLRRLLIDFQN